jgi:hypothetical protein
VTWQFILTDLYGNVHGEVTQASARKVTLPHLRVPSCSFTIPVWHDLAELVLDTDCLVKAYRYDEHTDTRVLAFHGPVVSAEENTEEGAKSIAVTCAGPFWRLTKRIIPSSKLKSGTQYGAEGALIDLGTIANTVLSDVNGHRFTGIVAGDHEDTTDAWAGKWHLKNAAEAIAELGAGLNSFEYRVRPTEPVSYANPDSWPRIGLFDTLAIIGEDRPNAIFEYGVPRSNMASYKRTVSRETLLTRAIISVSGWPDSIEKLNLGTPLAPVIVDRYNLIERSDADQISDRGLFEEVVNDAGVYDDGLRQNIADFHLGIRKNPKQIITFKPVTNARPAPLVDYNVGDFVRARAIVNGSLRFDAQFRIWGVTFDVDQNGNESVEIELISSTT